MSRPLAALLLASAALAQSPAFDVASVKRSERITPELVSAGKVQIGVTIDSVNVRISKFSLFDLTTLAYQVKPHQVSGPEWMSSERYDIQAKLPEGGRRGDVPVMLQKLLADRFGMATHRETREFNVYALVVAKGGPRLKAAAPRDTAQQPPAGQIRGGIALAPGGRMLSTGVAGDSLITPGPGGNLHIQNRSITVAGLVGFIGRYFDRPLIDMTGIEGTYDIEFDVSGEEMRAAARAHGVHVPPPPEGEVSDPSGPSIANSLQKLGLKLEARKAPAEVIVVDKVEKVPTEN